MRFHTSLTRAQRVSRKLLKLVRAHAAPAVSLGQAQAAVASAYGYKDWAELKHVATIDPRRSAWDEELPALDVEARRARQAQAFQDRLGLSALPAMILANTLQVTSSSRKASNHTLPTGHSHGAIEEDETTHFYATMPWFASDRRSMLFILSMAADGTLTGYRKVVDGPEVSRADIVANAALGHPDVVINVLNAFQVDGARGYDINKAMGLAGIDAEMYRPWVEAFASRLSEVISEDRRLIIQLRGERGPWTTSRERMGLSKKPPPGLMTLSPAAVSRLAAAARLIPALGRSTVRTDNALRLAEAGSDPEVILRAYLSEELAHQGDEPRVTLVEDLMGSDHRNTLAALKIGSALEERWVPRRKSKHWEPFMTLSKCLLAIATRTQRHPNDLFGEAGGDWTNYLASMESVVENVGHTSYAPPQKIDFVTYDLIEMSFEFERAIVRPALRREGIDLGDRFTPNHSWHRRLPYLFAKGGGVEIMRMAAKWSDYEIRPDVALPFGANRKEIESRNPGVTLVRYRGEEDFVDFSAFDKPISQKEMEDLVREKDLAVKPMPVDSGVARNKRCLEIEGHDVEGTLRNWEAFLPEGYPRNLDDLGRRWADMYRAWMRYEGLFEARMRAKGF